MFGKIISYVTFTLFLIFILLFRFNAPAYGYNTLLYPSQDTYLPPGKKIKQTITVYQSGILQFGFIRDKALVVMLEDKTTNTEIVLPNSYIVSEYGYGDGTDAIENVHLNPGKYSLIFINSDYSHGILAHLYLPTVYMTP